ncbi:hypothetical protein H0H87_006782 [Tephrocybe sp. NHM501043]|nr:hypothetical protein H0H87_006782 [Tephrocybe sp. NHM501043]
MNSRPPPPQGKFSSSVLGKSLYGAVCLTLDLGAPPSYAFVTRIYRSNLRPVVIFTAFLAGLFTLLSVSHSSESTENVPKITNVSIALGAMYMTIFLYGMYSAATQRVGLVRIYTLLAAFATLLVIAAGLTRVVTHFVFKDDLLKECTTLTTNQEIVFYGFWGPVRADILDANEAADWCRRSWDRSSWSEIVALLIVGVLGFLFTMLAFAYYRQLLDPSSAANATRAPSHLARMEGGFPTHYNPPYDTSVPNLPYAYSTHPQYAPPAGPPPGAHGQDETFVPPYDRDGKPPGYTGGDVKGYDADGKDPFSDFDGPSLREERDVTSRPHPGGPESFR